MPNGHESKLRSPTQAPEDQLSDDLRHEQLQNMAATLETLLTMYAPIVGRVETLQQHVLRGMDALLKLKDEVSAQSRKLNQECNALRMDLASAASRLEQLESARVVAPSTVEQRMIRNPITRRELQGAEDPAQVHMDCSQPHNDLDSGRTRQLLPEVRKDHESGHEVRVLIQCPGLEDKDVVFKAIPVPGGVHVHIKGHVAACNGENQQEGFRRGMQEAMFPGRDRHAFSFPEVFSISSYESELDKNLDSRSSSKSWIQDEDMHDERPTALMAPNIALKSANASATSMLKEANFFRYRRCRIM